MPVLPTRSRGRRARGKSVTVRLSPEVEERLRARMEETGLRQSEAVALLLEFALQLEAEIRDLEPELSCHATNRGIPISRAVVQLAGRSLGIEPVEVYAPVSGHA
jgi:predicted DNA-binding protein